MQRLARLSDEQAGAVRSLEPRAFRLFGDRGKGQHCPIVLREHMTNEIILVQALHDDDDDSRFSYC